MLFNYKAITHERKTIKGIIEASTRREALQSLWDIGYTVLDIEEGKEKQKSFIESYRNRVKSKDFIVFCRQFAVMMESGITAKDSLIILSKQIEGTNLGKILSAVVVNIKKGNTLADSFALRRDIFNNMFINLVEVGELGGNLDEILNKLAEYFEKNHEIREKIKVACMYPLVISFVALLVVVFLLVGVLPSFVDIFESMGAELPLITRTLLLFGETVRSFWFIIVPGITIAIINLTKFLKTQKGKLLLGKLFFKTPILSGIYKKILLGRFTRTMATLTTSGVTIIAALELSEKVIDNAAYTDAFKEAKSLIRKGNLVGESLGKSDLFPIMIIEMINVGEKTGALGKMLNKAADFYEKEVTTTVEKIGTVIEPVMIVSLAIVVGFIILAIKLPMFQIFRMIR